MCGLVATGLVFGGQIIVYFAQSLEGGAAGNLPLMVGQVFCSGSQSRYLHPRVCRCSVSSCLAPGLRLWLWYKNQSSSSITTRLRTLSLARSRPDSSSARRWAFASCVRASLAPADLVFPAGLLCRCMVVRTALRHLAAPPLPGRLVSHPFFLLGKSALRSRGTAEQSRTSGAQGRRAPSASPTLDLGLFRLAVLVVHGRVRPRRNVVYDRAPLVSPLAIRLLDPGSGSEPSCGARARCSSFGVFA